MRIRTRIALFGAAVVTATLLLFGLLLYALIAYGQRAQQDDSLKNRVVQEARSLAVATAAELAPRRSLTPIDLNVDNDTFVEILGAKGAILSSTGQVDGAAPVIDPGVLATAAKGHALATIQTRAGVRLRVYVQPWSRPDLGRRGYVVAGRPMRDIAQRLKGVRQFLVISALLSLVAAFAASWVAAGRALQPFRTMARIADEIGGTRDLSHRLPPSRPRDEVGRLSASFNGMLQRLEEAQGELRDAYRRMAGALDAQKRFVADASHELRTPLTTIRSNAGFLLGHPEARDGDRESALRDIAAEGERMSRLVQDLLTLARADAGQPLDKSPIPLAPIVRDVGRQAQALHPTRRLSVESGADGDAAVVNGNADALKQLVWILVDNAVKHTSEGGQIVLRLGRGGGLTELSVCDDGVGIPPPDLGRIFERFYQADVARAGGGAGLGLSIARWVVQDHGGRIAARNNDGRGATFTVALPLAGSFSRAVPAPAAPDAQTEPVWGNGTASDEAPPVGGGTKGSMRRR